jgi:alanine dehydrogenase
MWFGVPSEYGFNPASDEMRVALSPAGVRELVAAGAKVVVQSGAGTHAGFHDEAYRASGAHIVYDREEVFGRCDVLVKVLRPSVRDLELLPPEAAVMAFWHFAVAGEPLREVVASKQVTAIGYEIIQDDDGSLPVLKVSSEIAGKMAPQIAGRLLETSAGGLGILLGGAPGIPPADVVIIGAGVLGFHAARAFSGLGCTVNVLDISQERLESVDRHFGGRVITAHASLENIEKFSAFAEVLVGAVLVPGEVAPVVVSRDIVRKMKTGSVILDFSFDQGGCIETTRMRGPTGGVFEREGVLHFAVPNCPSYVARTSSHALTYALLPHLMQIQKCGVRDALLSTPCLQSGCYFYRGRPVSKHVTDEPTDLGWILQGS